MSDEAISRVIDGQKVVLERRICEGGCGKAFYVLPSSPERRARGRCEIVCGLGRTMDAIFRKDAGKKELAIKRGEAVALTDKKREEFEAVVLKMEEVADRGEKMAMRDLLPALRLSVPNFNYILTRAKTTYGCKSWVDRYKEASKKIRPRRGNHDVQEETDDEGVSPKLHAAIQARAEEMRAPLAVVAEPVVAERPRKIDMDLETTALVHVITTLKPLPKESRDRILGSVTVFLGLEA